MGTLERRRRTLWWSSKIWPQCPSTEWWMTTSGSALFTNMRRFSEMTNSDEWTRIPNKLTKKSKSRFTRPNSPSNTPKSQTGGPPRTKLTTRQSNNKALSQWEERPQWEVFGTEKVPRKSKSQTEKCSWCSRTDLRIPSSTWSRTGIMGVTKSMRVISIRIEPRAWARNRAALQCREWVA